MNWTAEAAARELLADPMFAPHLHKLDGLTGVIVMDWLHSFVASHLQAAYDAGHSGASGRSLDSIALFNAWAERGFDRVPRDGRLG
jgi:hypothetical protein